ADLDAAVRLHDEAVSVVGEIWDNSTFQARIRFSALLIGQFANAIGSIDDRRAVLEQADDRATTAREVAAAGEEHGRHGIEGRAWLARMEAELARLHWVGG